MKSVFIISSILTSLLALPASPAMACSCGKGANTGNQVSSCGCQTHTGGGCAGGCGGGECGGTEQSVSSGVVQEIKNTLCPVSGKPIGSMGVGVTYTHNGKSFQLCCAGCVERFKTEPEKYFQALDINK